MDTLLVLALGWRGTF